MAYPYKPPNQNKIAYLPFADIGAASSIFFCPGFSGRLKRISVVTTVAATGADTVITAKIGNTGNTTGTAITNGVVTSPLTGASIGNVAQAFPSALNTFGATDFIRLDSDGGATNSVPSTVTLEMEPT